MTSDEDRGRAIRDEGFFKTDAPNGYDVLKTFAKANRKNMTDAERLLWESWRFLHNGYKFRRQNPIGDYIADFACLSRKWVVEVDGSCYASPE